MEELEKLAREGKLRDLPGFGEKSEENILKAAGAHKKSSGRFHVHVVEAEAQKLGEYIASSASWLAPSRLPDRCGAQRRPSAIWICWSLFRRETHYRKR